MTQPNPQIQPQPTPEQWNVGVAQLPDGSKHVVVQITGHGGTKVSFLPPDVATTVGEQIKVAAAKAKTGLIIPTGVQLPNGHPGGAP
jgi:hypothetical protein